MKSAPAYSINCDRKMFYCRGPELSFSSEQNQYFLEKDERLKKLD
jgi:hypothetical protein